MSENEHAVSNKKLIRYLQDRTRTHLSEFLPGKPSEWTWKSMHGDGSTRMFFRIAGSPSSPAPIESSSKGISSLVVVYSYPQSLSKVNENDSYNYIAKHLKKRGIPVPEVYFYDREAGILAIEDLGDTHLQSITNFEKKPKENLGLYLNVIETLVRMQLEGVKGFDTSNCYDTPLYDSSFILERELKYFSREFLGRFGKVKNLSEKLQNEFRFIAQTVAEIPNSFFLHRDFQSRNIMVRNNDLFIIDFQAARLGPPTYDIASLLIDPYISMPKTNMRFLLESYYGKIREHLGLPWKRFERAFWLTALCRNLQILAAFAYLSEVKKKPFFKQFISPALDRLTDTLSYFGPEQYPALRAAIGF